MPGTCVPLTETLTSIPSSPSELLSRSPFELDEESPGRPPVGIELPEEDAVEPGLELLELEELDELELEGIEGEPELEELDTDGMEGELELDEDDDGMDGIEDEELELEEEGIEGEEDELLELEDAVGIDGDELELLLWVSVLHATNIRLNADTVKNALTGNLAAGLFMVLSRVLLMILPLSYVRLIVLHQALILTGPVIRRFHFRGFQGLGPISPIANKRQIKTLNYPANPGFSSLMTKP